MITSLEEEEAGLCASRAFVCLFVRVRFCHFSLPLGVVGWLRFVIVHSLDFSINFLLLCNKIFRILLLHVTVFCHVFFLCRYLCFCFFFFFFLFYSDPGFDSGLRVSSRSGHAKKWLMPYVNRKGAEVHPRSLISTFVVRCLDSMICILNCYIQSFKTPASFCN